MKEQKPDGQAALDAAGVGIWEWDAAAGRACWSAALADLHGLPPADGVGPLESLLQHVHAADRGMLRAALDRAAERRQEMTVDYRVAAPGGDRRLRWQGRGGGGRAAGVCLDVTAFWEAKQALREANAALEADGRERLADVERAREESRASEERYRDLFENANDAIFVHDMRGNCSAINRAGEGLLGYTREEMRTINLGEVVVPEHRPLLTQMLERKLANGGATTYELDVTARDGRRLTLEVRTRLICKDGKPVAVQGMAREVTERKRAEEARGRLTAILEATTDLVAVSHVEGAASFINAAGRKLLGVGAEEEVRLSDFRAGPWRDFVLKEALPAALRDGVWSGETVFRSRDGRDVPVSQVILAHTGQDGAVQYLSTIARDMTDRKRAEAALREQGAVLRNVLDHIPYSVFWKDRAGVYLGCNENLARDTGLGSPENVVGKTDYDMPFAREQADFFVKCDREVAETGRPLLDIEETQRRPDGGLAVLLTGKAPLRDADGRVVGVLGIYTDITERKEVEKALLESEQRFQAFMDALPGPAFLKDESGAYVWGNRGWARQFGRPAAELLGKTDFDLWPADTAALFRESDRAVLASGEGVERIERGADAGGGVTHWIVLKFPIRSASGNLLGGIALDTTERVRAVEALRASEERYRLLFERNLAGVVRNTADGRLLDCNEAFVRILGYDSREEVMGVEARDFYLQPADREALLARLHKQPALTNHEARLRRKDGSPVWVLQNVSLLADGEGGAVLESTLIDLTERKRLEEQFLQAQKMEAVGRLAGGVAHDFNNLLTVISGYSDLMLGGLAAADPLRLPAREIQKAAGRAADLTRQLLAFGRKTMVAPQSLDLNAVLHDTEQMLRRLIGEDVELHVAPTPGLSRVRIDPGQLQQVIVNLAVNARDAMPTGGRLTLTTSAAMLDEDYARSRLEVRPGRYVQLLVSDTGIGMTEEVRARLFEPFFTTKGVGRGTGLGLSTLYGIVKQAGGHVEVESEPGRGTTFRVYLPAADPPRPADEPTVPPAPARGAETVLLVEDEDLVRAMTREALRRCGYTVLEACDGPSALRTAERHAGPIHLLATDVVMPRMGGRELAERLTQARPGLKVLYLSGYTDDAVLRHGVREAEVAFLQKPFTGAVLACKVREVLDG